MCIAIGGSTAVDVRVVFMYVRVFVGLLGYVGLDF